MKKPQPSKPASSQKTVSSFAAGGGPASPTTAVEPRIEIDGEVTRRIRQHARAHMKTEVCGVLIGEDLSGVIEVRASIEALTATQAGTHVTFTQDAWEEIYRVKDEKFPDDRIVGWYHSHPGFGVFLSEHDLFIQQNFFSSPGQVAWVYDPHTDEEGCFGWVAGQIRRLSTLNIKDSSGSGVDRSTRHFESTYSEEAESGDDYDFPSEPREPKPKASSGQVPSRLLRWSVTFLSHAAAIMLGFAVASLLFPHIVALMVDPLGQPISRDGRPLAMDLGQHFILGGIPLNEPLPPDSLPTPAANPSTSEQPPTSSGAPAASPAPATPPAAAPTPVQPKPASAPPASGSKP